MSKGDLDDMGSGIPVGRIASVVGSGIGEAKRGD